MELVHCTAAQISHSDNTSGEIISIYFSIHAEIKITIAKYKTKQKKGSLELYKMVQFRGV